MSDSQILESKKNTQIEGIQERNQSDIPTPPSFSDNTDTSTINSSANTTTSTSSSSTTTAVSNGEMKNEKVVYTTSEEFIAPTPSSLSDSSESLYDQQQQSKIRTQDNQSQEQIKLEFENLPNDNYNNNISDDHHNELKTQQDITSNTNTEVSKPIKKKKKAKSSLAVLLMDADWYTTQLTGSKDGNIRTSSLKYENEKKKIRDSITNTETTDSNTTAEENDKDEPVKQKRGNNGNRNRVNYVAMKKLKRQQAAAKMKETKRIRAELRKEGKLDSSDNGEIITNEESEKLKKKKNDKNTRLLELLEGASYFASVKKIDDNDTFLRKTLNQVDRYQPEEPKIKRPKSYLTKSLFVNKLSNETLMKNEKGATADATPVVTKRKYKKRQPKEAKVKKVKKRKIKTEEEFEEEEEGEDYDYFANDNQEQTDSQEPSVEPSVEPEQPTPIWFLDFLNTDDIDIQPDRKFFSDQIYDLKINKYESNEINLVQAKDLVESYAKEFQSNSDFNPTNIKLSFPFSNYKEEYCLTLFSKKDDFNSFDEIARNMELFAVSFLPEEYKNKIANIEDPTNCLIGRYIESFETGNYNEIIKIIEEFNSIIENLNSQDGNNENNENKENNGNNGNNENNENNQLLKYVKNLDKFPLVSIYEILNQCYIRTVLPEAKKLSSYKAFSNYVYGELMPSFLTMVYKQSGLDANSTFIDLGSGVGNCCIQAALEFGCKSYGCEIMEHASRLCELQLTEFENRCKILGLNPGKIEFYLYQSFEDNKPVKETVNQCNVILCNNYLFDSKLNLKVTELFTDLKVGTKIISLKPIVPPGHAITWNNIDSILNRIKTTRYIYGPDSVSWTSNGGYYYISEVMDDIVDENFVVFQSRSKRGASVGINNNNSDSSRAGTPLNAFTHNV
ncbi:methyltransferase activity protein [[Candida] boidinii]|nr:methyltransferase activity protein [[Candida] boidinii]OWB62853.1 methyltransferase activity protein [[Candida] boidinii]OWB73811.1 methyltransferase activity protein [[Candida] boidinii]OWB79682.1 methyltransferase activity protein [[Candida] boidinii]